MPTYQVQQTWRAKRPKTVVSHDLEMTFWRMRNKMPLVAQKFFLGSLSEGKQYITRPKPEGA